MSSPIVSRFQLRVIVVVVGRSDRGSHSAELVIKGALGLECGPGRLVSLCRCMMHDEWPALFNNWVTIYFNVLGQHFVAVKIIADLFENPASTSSNATLTTTGPNSTLQSSR